MHLFHRLAFYPVDAYPYVWMTDPFALYANEGCLVRFEGEVDTPHIRGMVQKLNLDPKRPWEMANEKHLRLFRSLSFAEQSRSGRVLVALAPANGARAMTVQDEPQKDTWLEQDPDLAPWGPNCEFLLVRRLPASFGLHDPVVASYL